MLRQWGKSSSVQGRLKFRTEHPFMQKTDFFRHILQYSQNEGFSFLSPEQPFNDPKRMSAGKQLMVAGAATVAGLISGTFVTSGTGYNGQKKEVLVADLQRISEYCDLVGIKLESGAAFLRLLIDADDLLGETLVGRFALIHERAPEFQKYAMVMVRSWLWGDNVLGTALQVLTVFSLHSKAKHFIQSYADCCKHSSKHSRNGFIKIGGGLVQTYPWVIDLEDETITPTQVKIMGIKRMGGFVDKYKTEFFIQQ
jgi:hypothetical protein